MIEAASASECSLLFFEISGQLFAADPLEVVRVDRTSDELPTAELVASKGRRVLVAKGPKGEFQVTVDRVLGVRRFPHTALRRPPTLALVVTGARGRELMGMVLDGQTPVPIIDLKTISARAKTRANSRGR
ncbi:MAG: hypothetical protein JST54_20915 [Deltaproteobacteria bacterium]|nr:hypothetical protein [Deltaproteobacteria bacterium]